MFPLLPILASKFLSISGTQMFTPVDYIIPKGYTFIPKIEELLILSYGVVKYII